MFYYVIIKIIKHLLLLHCCQVKKPASPTTYLFKIGVSTNFPLKSKSDQNRCKKSHEKCKVIQ